MNSKSKTGFGLHDTARAIARRRKDEIASAENLPLPPPMRLSPETELALDLFIYAKQFKRPLAA